VVIGKGQLGGSELVSCFLNMSLNVVFPLYIYMLMEIENASVLEKNTI
jgi:hypothetical protein